MEVRQLAQFTVDGIQLATRHYAVEPDANREVIGPVEVRMHCGDSRDLGRQPGLFRQFPECARPDLFAPFKPAARDAPEVGVPAPGSPAHQHASRFIANHHCDPDSRIPHGRFPAHGSGSFPSPRSVAITSKSSATF